MAENYALETFSIQYKNKYISDSNLYKSTASISIQNGSPRAVC